LSVALLVLAAGLLALFALGLTRPWLGLVVLLAALPFNGLLLHVGAPQLGLSGTSATMLAAWHDAIAGGVIAAAGLRWLGDRGRSFGVLEAAVVVVLFLGLDSLIVAAHFTTALYAYRTLYEPVALMVAVVVLGRGRRLPDGLLSRVGLAIVISGIVASLFAAWQVYVGGYSFLDQFYRADDGTLSFAYFASQISQVRAVGTFNSPNEFGAYLTIAICFLFFSAAVSSTRWRVWAAVPLGLALILTMSRSGWLSFFFAIALLVLLLPQKRTHLVEARARLRMSSSWRAFGPPVVAFALVTSAILFTSGLPNFVGAMVGGRDLSGLEHIKQITGIVGGDITAASASPSPPEQPTPTASPTPTPIATPAPSIEPAASVTPGPLGSVGPSAAPASPAGTSPPPAPTAVPTRVVTVCREPSSGAHLEPFGMGLGSVGPKSDRFGETPVLLNSEMWYLDYLWQAGFFGLLALLALAAIIVRKLWSGRREAMSRGAIAVMGGLALGALFIPVLDEPTVAVPLWTLLAFGLLAAERAKDAAEPLPPAS
jgi:hypothetical protein